MMIETCLRRYILLLFLILITAFAGIAKTVHQCDEVITFCVAGQTFKTKCTTLNKELLLFSQKSIYSEKDACYVVDTDATVFATILKSAQDEAAKADAKHEDNSASKKFDDASRLKDQPDIKQLELTPISMEISNQQRWYIKNVDGNVIDHAFTKKEDCHAVIDEYHHRTQFKDLIYISTNFGFRIYNKKHNRVIGEYVGRTRDKKHPSFDRDNFLSLHLIEKAVESNHRHNLYLCTFNSFGNYAIFDAIYGERLLGNYASLDECVEGISANFQRLNLR